MLFWIENVENLLYTYSHRHSAFGAQVGLAIYDPYWYFWLAFGMLSTLTWL
jgi:hypothetical protein